MGGEAGSDASGSETREKGPVSAREYGRVGISFPFEGAHSRCPAESVLI